MTKVKKYRIKNSIKFKRVKKLFCLGFTFFTDNIEDLFRDFIFSYRQLLYQISPKTIRFKLFTSYLFPKIKKKFFCKPTFYIKRFVYYSLNKIKNFKNDLILYFRQIFILHWKFFILILGLNIFFWLGIVPYIVLQENW